MLAEDLVKWETHGVPVSVVVHHAYPWTFFQEKNAETLKELKEQLGITILVSVITALEEQVSVEITNK